MRGKFIPAIVMLIAGIVIGILNIVNKVEIVSGLKQLLIVLIIFYFIGLIAGKVINKAVREKTADKKEEISTEKAEEDVGRRPKEEESNSAEL